MTKKPKIMSFEEWFARYLKQDQSQVERLFENRTATQFLIAWSLFESHCFEAFAKVDKFPSFAKEVTANASFCKRQFLKPGQYFHDRYQNKRFYNNIIHKQECREFKDTLSMRFDDLTDYQLILMLVFVVYRFRNNIFHGNKGVESWLQFKDQILQCLSVMQSHISLTISSRS